MKIDRGDTEIAAAVVGDSGSPVLLLHGLGGSHEAWPGLIDGLARSHRVVAMDLRGSGGSPLGDEPLSFALLADDAAAVLDALAFDNAHVIGHSLGGVVTQELLVRHPGRCSSAVLVSTSSKVGEKAAQSWLRLADIIEARGLSDSAAGRTRAFSDEFVEQQPGIIEALGRLAARSDRRGYAAQARIAASYDYTERLCRITQPVLVIQGLADRLTSPGGSVILDRFLPHSRLEMLEGHGHNIHIEMGDRFVEMAESFFAGIDAGERTD